MINLDSEVFRRFGGMSWWLCATQNPRHKLAHVIFRIDEGERQSRAPLFAGKVVFLTQCAKAIGLSDQSINEWLAAQCSVEIWNDNTPVYFFRVGHKKNARWFDGKRSNVNQLAVWPLPNAMELRFEPNAREFVNSPATACFATLSSNLLFNDHETLVEWLVRERAVFDINGGTAAKGFAE